MFRPLLLLGLLAASSAWAQDDAPDSMRERAEERILERIERMDPARHAQLLELKRTDLTAYVAAMRHIHQQMRRGASAPNPEIQAQLEALAAIRARYPDGTEALSKKELKALQAEVRVVAERLFELKQTERRRRLEELQQAIAELASDVAQRDADKERRLDAFVDRFLEGPIDL